MSSRQPPDWAHWVTAGIIVFGPAALLLVLGETPAAVVAFVFGITMVLALPRWYPGDHPIRKLVGHRQPDREHLGRGRGSLSFVLGVLAIAGSLSVVTKLLIGEVPLGLVASLTVALCAGYLLVRVQHRS